jgi:hypothetical protein
VELSRRDALAALAVFGTGAGAGAAIWSAGDRDDEPPAADGALNEHALETLIAIAEVVYPSEIRGVEAFVRAFSEGRVGKRPELAAGIRASVRELDTLGRDWHDGATAELEPETRERLLRELGADTAEGDPDGSPAERVRYFLVNELLYALYASPTGGELVGIENPQGYPGGLTSYQRGPPG